jgi:hypothetical protein
MPMRAVAADGLGQPQLESDGRVHIYANTGGALWHDFVWDPATNQWSVYNIAVPAAGGMLVWPISAASQGPLRWLMTGGSVAGTYDATAIAGPGTLAPWTTTSQVPSDNSLASGLPAGSVKVSQSPNGSWRLVQDSSLRFWRSEVNGSWQQVTAPTSLAGVSGGCPGVC